MVVHVGGCLTGCVTSLISDLYQLAQAYPYNVLHFLNTAIVIPSTYGAF